MGNSHVQKAKINHPLSVCAPRMKNQEAKACPSVPQVGRITQYLGAQAQNPQHCQHPLAEHFYSAASIHAWARWKPLAQVCATSSKESCSPLQLSGTHMGSFTLSANKNLWNFCPLPQTKTYNNSRDSFREHSLKGSLRSHSLRSLFSTRSVTKILGLSREDTKTHWAKQHPLQTPCGSLYLVLTCL